MKKKLHFLFTLLNYNIMNEKRDNGKPYYNQIIKIKGFRTALVEKYDGSRSTIRCYWCIFGYYL